MKKFNFQIKIKVSKNWIDDGFSKKIAKESIENFIKEDMLPYAYPEEIEVEIK